MANNHVAGFRGYLEILEADGTTWYNLTPHISGYTAPRTDGTIEDTGMQPTGNYKSYIQGLADGSYDFTARLTPDGALPLIVQAIRATATGTTTIREFPFGKANGNYGESATILFTNPGSKTVSGNSPVEATYGCQMVGAPTTGVWNGTVLA